MRLGYKSKRLALVRCSDGKRGEYCCHKYTRLFVGNNPIKNNWFANKFRSLFRSLFRS